MSAAFNSFVRGIYLGLGFSLAAILMITAYELALSPKLKEINANQDRLQIEQQKGELRIDPLQVELGEAGVLAKLKISNNSRKYASSFILETEIFDKNGGFLGECMKTAFFSLDPGEIEYSQVFCGERSAAQYRDADLKKVVFKFSR